MKIKLKTKIWESEEYKAKKEFNNIIDILKIMFFLSGTLSLIWALFFINSGMMLSLGIFNLLWSLVCQLINSSYKKWHKKYIEL